MINELLDICVHFNVVVHADDRAPDDWYDIVAPNILPQDVELYISMNTYIKLHDSVRALNQSDFEELP